MFAPLKRVARAIFQDDIRLRRDGDGLRLVLEGCAAAPPPPRELGRQRARSRELALVAGMQADLEHALDEHPGVRFKLRHLAYIEEQLGAQGLLLLDSVPLGVLRLALGQLEGLVLNWSAPGLACLRSKLAVAVGQRSARDDDSDHVQDVPSTAAPAIDATESDEDESSAAHAALLAAYGSMAGAAPAVMLPVPGAACAANQGPKPWDCSIS